MRKEAVEHLLEVAKARREELHNTVHIGYPEFVALCEAALARICEGSVPRDL